MVVHDDFLEQMPLSMNELARGREMIPKIPRLLVSEGFYEKENWLRDVEVSMGGLEHFNKWFAKRKLDTPINNVWEFDISILIVPGVFFDDDLLVDMAKKYDPITRVVKNHIGYNLCRVSPELIREVFKLNPNHAIHEKIDMEDLQARYDAKKLYLRGGTLQQHFVKIGSFPLVTQNTHEPLLKKYFNPREQALYFSLYKIFGMDKQDHIQGSIILIMVQTL